MRAARTRKVAALLHHTFRVTGGIMRQECGAILKEFFKPRR
jgi:tRNA(Arg) A34 adenosine deaminase TadA